MRPTMGARAPVEQHVGARGGVPRIAVAVPDRGHADGHVLRAGPGRRVPDALALAHAVHGDQARAERHRRAQAEIRAGRAVDHRDAVQRAARAHPVGVRIGPAEDGGGIGERAFACRGRRSPPRTPASASRVCAPLPVASANSSELAKWFISTTLPATAGIACSRAYASRTSLGREAQAMHAAVDLQPAPDRIALAGLFEHRQLRGVVHDGFDVEAPQLRQVVRRVEAGQQHDGLREARRAQPLGIAQRRDAECVGALQRTRDAFQPVPVAVGLDHRHDPAARRACAHRGEVVAEGIGVDRRGGRSCHAVDFAGCRGKAKP